MAVTIFGRSKHYLRQSAWGKMLPYFGAGSAILAAMVAGKAFSFIWRVLLLRYDVAFLGEVEVFSTTLGLAVTFSTLAFPAALIRFSLQKKEKAQAYLRHSLLRAFQAFLLVGAALWLFSRFGTLFTANTQLPLVIFLVLIAFAVGHRLVLAYLNSQKRFALYGLGEYVITPLLKLVLLAAIFIGLFQKSFLFPHVVWSIALSSLLLIFLAFWKRKKLPANSLTKNEQRRFLSYSLMLSGSFLMYMVYGSLDVYTLQYFFNSTTVGIYAGILTFVNLMELVFLPLLHTFPAHLAEKRTMTAKIRFTTDTAQVLVKTGLILGVLGAFFGAFLLPLISGSVLQISFAVLLLFTIFKTIHFGLVHVYRHYLDFQGEQVYTAKTMGASLVLKIIFSLIFVPRWGIAGLAAANILTDLFHSWLLRRRMRASIK